ncbi:hypothetical protein PaecuDRAFT_1821 [Paenibacillus curdlanolyticus YK9]|uniref:Uncharacterized protein n=1 Tax=Paenibacillus curdlanolyticus YK9 TaxID=717606 RepID=E0I870_9BACL|nr:hypothetical protein [Paenibacillus curdlanolyticus]EFM11375.1 hypothetical protein PaecuDRAFT_1821 [Paenibacillus curdlanolyticus YK9]
MSSLTSVLLVRNSGTLALNKYKFNLYTYISEGGNWHVLVPNLLGKPLIAFGQKLSMELNAAVFVLEWHDDYIWKTLLIQNGEELAGIKLDLERPKRSKIQAVEAMRDFVLDEAAFDQFLNLVNQDASQLSIVGLEQGFQRMLIVGDLTEVNYDSLWSLNDTEIEAMRLHHIANKKGLDLKQLISKSFRSTLEEELSFSPICEDEAYKFVFYYHRVIDGYRFRLKVDAYHKGMIRSIIEGPYGYKMLGTISYHDEKELREKLAQYLSSNSHKEDILDMLNRKVESFEPENTYSSVVDGTLQTLGFVRTHTDEDLLRTGYIVSYQQVEGEDLIRFKHDQLMLNMDITHHQRQMDTYEIYRELPSGTGVVEPNIFNGFTNEAAFQARMNDFLQLIKAFYAQ